MSTHAYLTVAWLVCTSAITLGAVTRCTAPTVFPGDPASITCYFSEDIRQTKKNIKVQRRKTNATDFDPDSVDTIVDCYWLDADNINCDVQSGYSLDDPVSRRATVRIAKASEKHVGRYMCEAVPSDPSDIEACDFQLKREPPYLTLAEFQGKILIPTILAVLALVLSLCFWIARLFTCVKKRCQRKQTEEPPGENKNSTEMESMIKGDKRSRIEDEDVDPQQNTAEQAASADRNTNRGNNPVEGQGSQENEETKGSVCILL